MKKILIIFSLCLFSIFGIVGLKNNSIAFADSAPTPIHINETYDGSVNYDNSSMPVYSVDNFDIVKIDGYNVFRFATSGNGVGYNNESGFMQYAPIDNSWSGTREFKSFTFSYYIGSTCYNYLIIGQDNSIAVTMKKQRGYYPKFYLGDNVYIYVSPFVLESIDGTPNTIHIVNRGNFDDISTCYINSSNINNVSSLLDMDADTTFSLPNYLSNIYLYDNSDFNYFYTLFVEPTYQLPTINHAYNEFSNFYITAVSFSDNSYINLMSRDYTYGFNYFDNWCYFQVNSSDRYSLFYYFVNDDYGKDYTFIYKDITFYINNVNSTLMSNTLVLYNYDYDMSLSKVNHIDYVLGHNGVYDKINYNGGVSNNLFAFVTNEILENSFYTDYYSVTFDFSNYLSNFTNLGFTNKNYVGIYDLGFDFNFNQYVTPLVASNGSYNYTFKKPGYVKMKFSLAPFYIPVLEILENALIFLVFYCPLISDFLEFIHFDSLFGGLTKLFTFLMSDLGSFMNGMLGFIIFFSLVKKIIGLDFTFKKETIGYTDNNVVVEYKDRNEKYVEHSRTPIRKRKLHIYRKSKVRLKHKIR